MSLEKLDQKAEIPQLIEDALITNLMYMIWHSRKDLQVAFDLSTEKGQEGFQRWYQISVLREYGIRPGVAQQDTGLKLNPSVEIRSQTDHIHLVRLENRLRNLGKRFPAPIRKLGKALWIRHLAQAARNEARNDGWLRKNGKSELGAAKKTGNDGAPGANLIGYAQAELGMGEHVRMSAAALDATDVKFGVLNFDVGVSSRKMASLDHGLLITGNDYYANIFHVNADQMLVTYCHLGHDFFANRYNIGYWAWELSKCPEAWIPVIEMVDEIWAPSRFIQAAFAEKTGKPVEYMPLCVTLQPFLARRRIEFKLPENHFLFLFAFDFLSYIERKNPFAAIQAFQIAFPDSSSPVGLVIKIMNGDLKNLQWKKMMAVIDDDPRIYIINQTMSRSDVLALIDSCNSFVSLHRSEGFGRGPAEAMLLGKPVIVTNYSGNTDFTLPDNSCLVNYRLIPVEAGQYVFEDGQVWADVDVEHAAWQMRRLVESTTAAAEIGLRGQNFIRTNFNQSVIGEIYAKRLKEIIGR